MSATGKAPKSEWRILLADDDDDYVVIIERALRHVAGVPIEIRRARNGGETLAILDDFVSDLLLLDLKMPGMAGHDVLEVIKADDRLRSVPVAILSSSDRDRDVAKSYSLGGNHYIMKPDTPSELEIKLAALLRNLGELRGIRRGSVGGADDCGQRCDPALDGGDNVVARSGGRGRVDRPVHLRKNNGRILSRLS